jgi:hypothetical protein
MNYLEDFLNRNQGKSFFTNLMKYNNLGSNDRLKCISSLLTHLIIDSESNLNKEYQYENITYQKEVLLILNDALLYKNDYFFDWLKDKIS